MKTWMLAAAGLLMTSPAWGFFPPVPQPGEVITSVPPKEPEPVVVKPVDPVVKPPVKPVEKPTCTCDPEGPQRVPEPATIVAAITGLAAWRLRKRIV